MILLLLFGVRLAYKKFEYWRRQSDSTQEFHFFQQIVTTRSESGNSDFLRRACDGLLRVGDWFNLMHVTCFNSDEEKLYKKSSNFLKCIWYPKNMLPSRKNASLNQCKLCNNTKLTEKDLS
jgi:hypothetical protein